MTSLAGNGGKVEESFTPDGSIPVLSLGCGVSTINVEGMDGMDGRGVQCLALCWCFLMLAAG